MIKLYAKLLNIQKKVGAITKDSTNPFFKSQYFDINGLLTALKPLLNEEGLIVLQPLSHIENRLALQTIIVDVESGESITHKTILPENTDPQKLGSAITYFRRYALQSFFLLQAQDDDANSAKVNPTAKPRTAESMNRTSKRIEAIDEAGIEIGLDEAE